jgi:hypothetical protein
VSPFGLAWFICVHARSFPLRHLDIYSDHGTDVVALYRIHIRWRICRVLHRPHSRVLVGIERLGAYRAGRGILSTLEEERLISVVAFALETRRCVCGTGTSAPAVVFSLALCWGFGCAALIHR